MFRNPWAWIGLVAVLGPLVAHLLARRPARRQRFPTLRFFPAGIERPISRDRLTDVALLIVRAAIVATAVAALAQPVWLSPSRARELGNELARAIIVDTSASMWRDSGSPGGRTIDIARRVVPRLQPGATLTRAMESDNPASMIPAAIAWLQSQSMRRQMVFVSDFQTGTLTQEDVDRIPASIGFLPSKVAGVRTPVRPTAPNATIAILAGDAERVSANAAMAAASAEPVPVYGDGPRRIAVMFPQYAGRDGLVNDSRGSRALALPWMFGAFDRVRSDGLLVESVAREGLDGAGVVGAVEATIDNHEVLVLTTTAAPHSVTAAALIRAAIHAAANTPSPAEMSVAEDSVETRRAWQREPAAAAPDSSQTAPGDSFGRWLWGVVLVLLGIETLVRRRRPAAAQVRNETHDRAA